MSDSHADPHDDPSIFLYGADSEDNPDRVVIMSTQGTIELSASQAEWVAELLKALGAELEAILARRQAVAARP